MGGTLADIIAAPGIEVFEAQDVRATIGATVEPVASRSQGPDVWEDYVSACENGRFARAARYVRSYPGQLPLLRDVLPDAHVPVRVFGATDDPLVPLSNAGYLAERVPGSELTVLTAGQFAWEEVPGQFASMAADWVTRAETGPSGYGQVMGADTGGLGGTAPGVPTELPDGTGDRLISFPGRSPVLDAAQLGVLRGYGSERDVAAGDVLFADGDETYDMIVLLAGTADIIEGYGQPGASVVASYGPSEFLGEIGMLTGQRAFLSAVATSAGRVLAVPVARLRRVMAQEPGLSDLILRTFLLRHSILLSRGTGLTLIGSRFDPDTRRLLEVLARNRLVWAWLDLEASPKAEQILQGLDVPVADLPIIIVPGGPVLRNPGSRALLDALAISGDTDSSPPGVCDLLVVGAGPAGLAASVYGASDGMATTLAEDTALGGQAGTSSRIENYLGFPAGLSGEELAARGTLQAQKFGARIKLAAKAASLSSGDGVHQVTFDDGEAIQARSVIIATGARYNRLPVDRLAEFEGVGVYYAATQAEAQACGTGPVAIVGGGNSAGQAALFLSRSCTKVHLIIRRDALDASMSRYLVDRIERNPGIVVWPSTQVTALNGTTRLETVRLRRQGQAEASELAIAGLFVFIGARPGTGWLAGQLAEDRHGFLLTGSDIPATRLENKNLTPLFLETSRPGIFAVGDVRSGSVKRVAAAIGEGSVAVRLAFERLQSEGTADPIGLAAR